MKYQSYSKTFKFKNVTQYLKQKGKISLNSFANSICGMDNSNHIMQGSVNESTFRDWIKKYKTYDCEEIYELLSTSNNTIKNKNTKNKKLKKIKLNYLKNCVTDIHVNTINHYTNQKNENQTTALKNKRMKYSYTFKKKWVLLYKENLNKLSSFNLTYFAKLINGNDGPNLIKKGYVDESTFRKWIFL